MGSEEDSLPDPNDVPDENSLAAEDEPNKEPLVEATTVADGMDEDDDPN